MDNSPDTRTALDAGDVFLGIELGSTRIKAALIGPDHTPIAGGSHAWEAELRDGLWTYSLDDVWAGLRACVSDLWADVERTHGARPASVRGLGISAMMHGYLAFNDADELLAPFRTWRNTNTGPAARRLTELLQFNMPLRWSVSHLTQALIDDEPHVGDVRFITTLAGYVHWKLTGRKVLGVGDASGMFPIDPATHDYDQSKVDLYDAEFPAVGGLRTVLPEVLVAGDDAGQLTDEGAALLDPAGILTPGTPLCAPEGDAGTGMVATNAVAPRTGNVSTGTSVFAMVVLEKPLERVHEELDVVTTPAGDLVAMVHCNNGAAELEAWVRLFAEVLDATGANVSTDQLFEAVLGAALEGGFETDGVLAYNYLSGEPVAGLENGRPVVVRQPDSKLTLPHFAASQLYGVFAALALGMEVLAGENVKIDRMFGHGGIFRTKGVAQQALANAINAPVAVGSTAGEGGAWGIAVLAAYAVNGAGLSLSDYLDQQVFADAESTTVEPDTWQVASFHEYLADYRRGLPIVAAAVETMTD